MSDKFGNDFTLVGAVALVKGRVKNDLKLMKPVELYLDEIVKEKWGHLLVPYKWIALLYLYGIKNDLKLRYERINKKDGDLPISLELDMEILQWADQNNLDLLRDIFMIAALEALIQVGKKYKLPTIAFEEERSKYGDIPNNIEECIAYKR